jgi:DNA-binding response OmpR family regulator
MNEEIWIVDDERSILEALVTVLREHGLTVRGFCDPRRALEQALRDPPPVLLTDYAMPHLNGVDLARTLRERLASACPRILLVTARDLRRVELTLFDHVVRKPFRLADLVPKVQSYLTSPRARRPASHPRLRATALAGQAGGQRK